MQKLTLILVACAATVAVALTESQAVEPSSQLIGCDQANQEVHLTQHSHLDPSCTYTRGFHIESSNITLDCQGAHIAASAS